MKSYASVSITSENEIGQAARAVRRCASFLPFGEERLAHIDIAVREIGSNAVKFGHRTGKLYFSLTDPHFEPPGIDILYMDKGPGIDDTGAALRDGYSTSDSMGVGLGSIRRMADEFYIYSGVQSQTRRLPMYGRTTHGTAIVFRKYAATPEQSVTNGKIRWGAFSRPVPGDDENGDAYVIQPVGENGRLLIAVIDGLGHGGGAREAAQAAVESLVRCADAPVEASLRTTHEALKATRGAVAGLAKIDTAARVIEYAGIGNTEFRALGGNGHGLKFISLNGTLGSRLDRIKVFKEELPRAVTLVFSTDGISPRWDLDAYPGLLGSHPQILCASLMRDFGRDGDDATILCGRISL